MSTKELDKLLENNPRAKKHERVIRETIEAIKKLEKSGISRSEYDLASPYGGKRTTNDQKARRLAPKLKMSFGA